MIYLPIAAAGQPIIMLRANEKVVKKKNPWKIFTNIKHPKIKISNQGTKDSADPREWDNLAHFQKWLHRDTRISICENLVSNIFPVFETLEFHSWPHPLNLTSPSSRRKNQWRRKHVANTLGSFICIISWNPYNNSATWNLH